MSILTTSQLTFCDLKDSYSLHLDKEYIGVACDSNGTVPQVQYATIKYRVLAGVTRVAASCTNYDLPNGVRYYSDYESTSTSDGEFKVWLPAESNLCGQDTASMKLTLKTSDGVIFERYVTFIKTRPGKDGSEGIEFQIYSTDGFEFNDDVENIELETAVLKNGSPITTGTYAWYYYDKASDNPSYIAITNEGGSSVTTSSLIVNVAAPYALCSLKCVYTSTDNQSYTDYVSLTKKQSGYVAVAKFWDGKNTVSAGQDYLIAYIDLYKDNEWMPPYSDTSLEIKCTDTIQRYDGQFTVQYDGKIVTTRGDAFVTGTSFVDGDLVYVGCYKGLINNTHKVYNVLLVQYRSGSWYNIGQNYTYKTEIHNYIQSPIVMIPSAMIDGGWVVDFEVWNLEGTSRLARTSATVLDFGDAVIGDRPESPKVGQLWFNSELNVLQMWDGEQWIDTSYQHGNSTYTSQPINGYREGDMWVLNDIYEDYIEDTSVTNTTSGVYYKEQLGGGYKEVLLPADYKDGTAYYKGYIYGVGSVLVATRTSSVFNIADWKLVDPDGEEQKQNIRQYFTFDKNRGFKISQGDDKFYVNIDSQEMGFYDNSDLTNPHQKVVSISNKSAKIKNATLEESASFLGPATFNQQINIKQNSNTFVWKIESNGSLSLSIG